jgi:hypothetical protein
MVHKKTLKVVEVHSVTYATKGDTCVQPGSLLRQKQRQDGQKGYDITHFLFTAVSPVIALCIKRLQCNKTPVTTGHFIHYGLLVA